MALPAQSLFMENPMEERLARIESDVKHLQSDVSDIKDDVQRLDAKIDAVDARLSGKIDSVKDGLASLALSTERSFARLERSMFEVKIWALTLYFALASALLLVMARGFKWI